MANWVNLIAGVAEIVIAIAVVFELFRIRRGFPRVALLLILFFLVDGAVAVNRPDPLLPYSPGLDAVLTVIDLTVLLGLLVYVRRLVRGALKTVDEADLRAREYERARRDYSSLVRHRLANPLMTISGAARTLRAGRGDPERRDELLQSIIDASEDLEKVSVDPYLESDEESGLDPVPWLRLRRRERDKVGTTDPF
jgi:signal transduction histidine kinase